LVAAPAERDHRRPFRERLAEAGDRSSLLIDADPQRQFLRERLRLARQLRHLLRLGDVAREEDHAAEIERLREPPQVFGNRVAREAGDRELSRMTAEVPERHADDDTGSDRTTERTEW